MSVLFGLPDGGLAPGLFQPPDPGWMYGFVVADMNGDGWPDLLTYGGRVQLFINQGDGGLVPAPRDIATSGNADSAAVGDFDGDDRPDVVVCDSNVGITFYFDQGGVDFGPGIPLSAEGPAAGSCFDVVTADFDGDHIPDLAWTVRNSAAIYVRLGAGHSSWGPVVEWPVAGNPVWLRAGDLNGDGKPDLAATTTNGVAVLLNSGGGAFGPATSLPPVPLVDDLSTIDIVNLNGSCYPAIVASGSSLCDDAPSGEVLLYVNDGAGGFAAGQSIETGTSRPIGAVGYRPANERSGLALGDACVEGLTILPNSGP